MVEPFRCIIDYQVHKSFSQKQFTSNDFDIKQNAYFLKPDKSIAYMTVFYNILVENKLLFVTVSNGSTLNQVINSTWQMTLCK